MNNTEYKYQIVKNYLTDMIENNKIFPGERIPGESELSKKLNVSIITVRKALSELVNESRIYRIKGKGSFVADIIKKDRNDRKLTNRLIGFVLSARQESYDSSLMKMTKGIQSYLSSHGYTLIVEYSNECLEMEEQIICKLIDDGINGIIYFSDDPDKNITVLKKLNKQNIPFVLVDRYAKAFPTNYVTSNNFAGAYNATEYLINLGHKKIAFVTYNDVGCLSSECIRLEGYHRAMDNASLPVMDEMIINRTEVNDGRLASMIKNRDVTAIFGVNDVVALEVMEMCIQNSIMIPDDVSILGFDDIEKASYQNIPLTTVKQYFNLIGGESARMLVKMLLGNGAYIDKIELSTNLIIRKSVSVNKYL